MNNDLERIVYGQFWLIYLTSSLKRHLPVRAIPLRDSKHTQISTPVLSTCCKLETNLPKVSPSNRMTAWNTNSSLLSLQDSNTWPQPGRQRNQISIFGKDWKYIFLYRFWGLPSALCDETVRWGEFSQKHNYKYMDKWWCLLAIENCMFRPIAAIFR